MFVVLALSFVISELWDRLCKRRRTVIMLAVWVTGKFRCLLEAIRFGAVTVRTGSGSRTVTCDRCNNQIVENGFVLTCDPEGRFDDT